MSNVFANIGSTVIQRPSLELIKSLRSMRKPIFLWVEQENKSMMPVDMHLQNMDCVEANKKIARVKVLLQVMYLIAVRDKSLSQEDVEELVFFKEPNVPIE